MRKVTEVRESPRIIDERARQNMIVSVLLLDEIWERGFQESYMSLRNCQRSWLSSSRVDFWISSRLAFESKLR